MLLLHSWLQITARHAAPLCPVCFLLSVLCNGDASANILTFFEIYYSLFHYIHKLQYILFCLYVIDQLKLVQIVKWEEKDSWFSWSCENENLARLVCICNSPNLQMSSCVHEHEQHQTSCSGKVSEVCWRTLLSKRCQEHQGTHQTGQGETCGGV